MYEGIQLEVLSTTRFDENSDLSTTYLGKADKSKNNKVKAEESFSISEQGYTMGKLLEGTECQILLDMGASKILHVKINIICAANHSTLYTSLYPKPQRIQVGNGQFVSVLFIIPVIVDIHGHRFGDIHIGIRNP